ncbi:MAG TPA: phospholipase D-like domain-containing protein [Pedobacter sp.]|uniref:phospholipase D-like domain-containing protein n=1 Tax=Pedobacter sp. TaxID=1411316 RepID=UPI002C92ED69|nr:phospholipase D-like domain-containing protein [Pedobacter sp.]HMI02393.1 phospholipase D-like domain-containing protein [Pedobacter sp.]
MKYAFENIQVELLRLIHTSKSSIKIAVTWFTNHEIFDAVLEKMQNESYTAELIVLNDHINNKKQGLDFQKFIELNGDFYYSEVENMVHHKFCIIDEQTLITGSYNWTYYAEKRNWENIIMIQDPIIVEAYLNEFKKIINRYTKIDIVISRRNIHADLTSIKYLKTDYMLQAQNYILKGDKINGIKAYTEVLKLDNKDKEIEKNRANLLDEINSTGLDKCPFEIGIKYKGGYVPTILANVQLPVTVVTQGRSSVDNATALKLTIQKYEHTHVTILEFSLINIKPCPKGTVKLENTLTLNKSGLLIVNCRELNGYSKATTKVGDLKRWL